jgi:predicted nucleotidyltransferase
VLGLDNTGCLFGRGNSILLDDDDRLIATEEGWQSVRTTYSSPRDFIGTQVLTQ